MSLIRQLIKSQKGVSTIQVIILGSAVAVMGVAGFKMSENFSKVNQSLIMDVKQVMANQEIRYQLSNEEICLATVSQITGDLSGGSTDPVSVDFPLGVVEFIDPSDLAGRVAGPRVGKIFFERTYELAEANGITIGSPVGNITLPGLPELQNLPASQPIYYGDVKLEQLRLVDYVGDPGIKLHNIKMEVRSKRIESKKGQLKSYSENTYFPIFLITDNNRPIFCLSDGDGSSRQSIEDICAELVGPPVGLPVTSGYDSSTGECVGIEDTAVGAALASLCSASETGPGDQYCLHPYRNETCASAGSNYGIRGFNPDGSVQCQCIPVCPDPDTICAGEPLGDDGCGGDCGVGTKGAVGSPLSISFAQTVIDWRTDNLQITINNGGPNMLGCVQPHGWESPPGDSHCNNGIANYSALGPPDWVYSGGVWTHDIDPKVYGYPPDQHTYYFYNPDTCRGNSGTVTIQAPSKGPCSATSSPPAWSCTNGNLPAQVEVLASPAGGPSACCEITPPATTCTGMKLGCR